MIATSTPMSAYLRRVRAHRTQSEVREALSAYGVMLHIQTISRLERGAQLPSADVLHAYAQAFCLDAAHLLALAADSRAS